MTKSTDISAKDAIAHIEELTTLQSLMNFVPDAETRVTVRTAYTDRLEALRGKSDSPKSRALSDYLFTLESLPLDGEDVRVRPAPSQPFIFGQGQAPSGPRLQEVQFNWSQALVVLDSCQNGIGDPDAGVIHSETIAQSPELFMSESNYQSYISKNEE